MTELILDKLYILVTFILISTHSQISNNNGTVLLKTATIICINYVDAWYFQTVGDSILLLALVRSISSELE